MYFLIMLCGLTAVILFFPALLNEARERKEQAARLLHTRFVSLYDEIDPVELNTTQVLIGRDKQKNDICLINLKNSRYISRVHACLWWAGDGFRIKPVYKRYWGKWSLPVVKVKGESAPVQTGLPVRYGDEIEIQGHWFTLENTAADGSMPYFDDMITFADQSADSGRARGLGAWFAQLPLPRINPDAFRMPQFDPDSFHMPQPSRKPRTGRKRRVSGRLLAACIALVLVLSLVITGMLWIRRPAAGDTIGDRKSGTATVLLCGADKEGIRTDTMILCYISASEGRIGLLSLPRDSLTTTDAGEDVRLNSIYGRNGRGEAGMEVLMEHVKRSIGYKPDGYLLVEMDMLPEIVDTMGGVTTTLKKDIHIPSDNGEIYIPAGERNLDGTETLAALRYRAGYDNRDLGRIEVQRRIINDCMSQWVTLENVPRFFEVVEMVKARTLTNLSDGNMAWIAMTVLMNKNSASLESDTLPVLNVTRYGASYLLLDGGKIVKLINESYNPYDVEIELEDLVLTD